MRKLLLMPACMDSLRVKLFLAIAGANVVLALVSYCVVSHSFDQGFVEYLNRADEARLTPLLEQLAQGYQQQGDWLWLVQDRHRWQDLVRETLGMPRPAHMGFAERGAEESEPKLPPPMLATNKPVLTIDPRLLLLNANQQLLLGRREMVAEALLKPVLLQGVVVGYLGYVPRLNVVESLEKVFSAQQNRKFAAIMAGMLLSGLLVGALLAQWLSRRIRRLAQATGALIQGDYQPQCGQHQGQDEIAQLSQDLDRLAETLAAAQHARQQWIADIAHELRTPLTSLRAEMEALEDGVRHFSPASLTSLMQEVLQLTRLVEDLHLLSLSDLGALSYQQQPLDLAELVADCLATKAAQLAESGIELRLQLTPGLMVLADGARLAQVIANLLQNTLKYTDKPGILSVSLQQQAQSALLLWQDSSPGVCDADLEHLTERLFRVDASRSRAGGGSGLGLAIVKAIVQAQAGQLVASHSLLGGLCWQLNLPLTETGRLYG